MTTLELYRKHKNGDISREKFLYEVRRDNNLPFITNLTSYDDAVKILKNKGIVTEVDTKEAKADEAVKAEVKAKAPSTKKLKELHVDQANPYEYRHGLQYELGQIGEYTDEALEKAKTTVLKNLAKDVNFYSNLLNAKQSPFTFKATETDAPGMQAKADGHLKKEAKKDEKSNVQDSLGKKEAGKKKPKGVKVMPDKGVTGSEKTIKEGLKGKFDSDDNIYTYDHLIKTDSPNKEELSKVLDAIKKDKEELEKKGKKVKQVKGDTVPYLELIKESVEDKVEDAIKSGKLKPEEVKAAAEKTIKENIEISQDQDEIEISADSGNYSGFIEDDGTISFSVVFYDMEDIENEFGPEGITKENWKNVLGPDHAFVEIINSIGGDVEALDDYVQITVNADKLLDKYSNIKETFDDKKIKDKIESGEIKPEEVKAAAEKAMKGDSTSLIALMTGIKLSEDNMESTPEDKFNQLISQYDWYYEMSDDPRAYDRGTSMDNQLKALGKQIGVDKAVDLFNDKAPSDRKITSSFFMEGKEDKHSKLKEALKKALKEADPKLKPVDDNIAKKETELANLYTQKANILKQPGTQG